MLNLKLLLVGSALLGSLLASRPVLADEPKREPQDYGGPPSETTVGDVVVWPVRVVLFPLWLLTEFVLRRPMGALVQLAERDQWVEGVTELFTFGERKQFTIYPSAMLDFGLRPSVGFNASYKYLGHENNTADLHFGTWGPDWIAVKATDSFALDEHHSVFVETALVRRKDNPFSGMGPRSRQDDRTRYASTIAEADVGHVATFWGASAFRSRAGLRSLAFHDGGCCGDPSIADGVAQGRFAEPPGYGRGYTGPFQRLELELDTRKPRPHPGGGLRAEAHEEAVFPMDAPNNGQRRSWVRYGGSVGAAVDLTRDNRVIALSVAAEAADPLQGTIPFTDQVVLGGDFLMQGYLRGRLVDRTATVATLTYTWPIWVYLDGVAHAAVGNVWGPRFAGFDVKAARLSSGIGFRSNGARESGFEALFAIGTDPFDEGGSVSSFRLVVGSHHGF